MKKFSLNLIYLKYFFDAVQNGSVSASAKINCVSQSAISQGILKLEESLGCLLIDHQPNRFKPTDEGKKLFENSADIFQAIQRAEESFSKDNKGTIEFACTHSFALAFLSDHLKQARKLFPSLQLNFRLGHAHSIMEWVKKGIINFGILLDNSDLSSFHCEEIYQGQYRLYVSQKYATTDCLSFLLDSEERTETNLLKKSYKARYGQDLPVLMEISSWEVIANLTEEGLGIGFFPDYVACNRHPHLKPYHEEIVSIPYKIYAIFSNNVKKSRHVLDFLKLLQEYQKR
jgi:DNA-binding transcriptional LysR family regulator